LDAVKKNYQFLDALKSICQRKQLGSSFFACNYWNSCTGDVAAAIIRYGKSEMCQSSAQVPSSAREATPRSPEANETQPESQRRAARQPTRRSPKTNGAYVCVARYYSENQQQLRKNKP
jgi:hypothetical protein